MSSFSERSRVTGTPNAISRALAHADTYLQLAESNPTAVGLSWDAEALGQLLADARAVHYRPEPFGLREAREALSAELEGAGFTVPLEQILLTASTSEAYSYLFKLLCDPGDSVLVPTPSYPLLELLARLENVRLIPYQLVYDGEWHVDLASLARAREARTRAVVTVHPNNPTGSFLKQAELSSLAALELPIISDEVFSEYAVALPSPACVPSALAAADRTLIFRLGGLSKALCLPQLKLAWTAVAGPQHALADACERLTHIADTYLSPATPVQLALPRLLARGATLRARVQARIQANLETLSQAFSAGSMVSVLRMEGGWYAILRLPAVLDEEAWVLRLLEQDRVNVQPGYFFDLGRGTHVVLSLICEERTFSEGVRRIAARVIAETA